MSDLKFTSDLDAKTLMKIAVSKARSLQFTVTAIDDRSFYASQGNLALSIFVGAFVAYCNFRISVREYDDGTDLDLVRNTPWWTGLIGVNRVKNRALELLARIRNEAKCHDADDEFEDEDDRPRRGRSRDDDDGIQSDDARNRRLR